MLLREENRFSRLAVLSNRRDGEEASDVGSVLTVDVVVDVYPEDILGREGFSLTSVSDTCEDEEGEEK